MKYLDNEIVKPFVGIGQIKLGMNYEEAIKVLKNNNNPSNKIKLQNQREKLKKTKNQKTKQRKYNFLNKSR